MASLAAALHVLNELVADGVLEQYAVGGAMAMVFWAEPRAGIYAGHVCSPAP